MHSKTLKFFNCEAQRHSTYSTQDEATSTLNTINSFDQLVIQHLITPRLLSSCCSSPNLNLCPVLLCLKCRIWHLINFMSLVINCCVLPSSLCKDSCLLNNSQVSIIDKLDGAFRFYIDTIYKNMNRTFPKVKAWETPLASCWPDAASSSHVDNSFRRLFWDSIKNIT